MCLLGRSTITDCVKPLTIVEGFDASLICKIANKCKEAKECLTLFDPLMLAVPLGIV